MGYTETCPTVCWLDVCGGQAPCVCPCWITQTEAGFFTSHPKGWEQWRLNCDPGMKTVFSRQPEVLGNGILSLPLKIVGVCIYIYLYTWSWGLQVASG